MYNVMMAAGEYKSKSQTVIDVTMPDFNSRAVHVIVTRPVGTAGSFHIMADNRYRGSVVKCHQLGWRCVLQNPDSNNLFYTGDLSAIEDIVTEFTESEN